MCVQVRSLLSVFGNDTVGGWIEALRFVSEFQTSGTLTAVMLVHAMLESHAPMCTRYASVCTHRYVLWFAGRWQQRRDADKPT